MLPLFVRGNLAAHADVTHRGHEDQEPPGQSNVAGDAGALLGDGLLGNLHQNLLARFQQITNDRQIRRLHRAPRRSASSWRTRRCTLSSTASPSAAAAIAMLLAFGG